MRKRVLAVLLLTGAAFAACGKERWTPKTTIPARAEHKQGSVALLRTFLAPTRAVLDAHPTDRLPAEQTIYALRAELVGFKHEADDDYHVVLREPGKPALTMIVEIPSEACVKDAATRAIVGPVRSYFVATFGKVSGKFKKLPKPVLVDVEGPIFFDFLHGQTGVSPNGAELHPVTKFQVVK